MTLLHVGAELEAFDRLSASCSEVNTGGTYNATGTNARGSIHVPVGQYINSCPFIAAGTATSVFGLRFDWRPTGFTLSWGPGFYLFNTAGAAVFRLTTAGAAGSNTSNTVLAQTSPDGVTWTSRGSAFYLPADVLYNCTLSVKINSASGFIKFYSGDITMLSVTGIDLSAITEIAGYQWLGSSFGAGEYVSAMIAVADEDPRDWILVPMSPNGAGADTAASGAYTDVNELVLDDSTMVSWAANGDKETFTHAAVTLPSQHDVKALVVSSRARIGASGIANFKSLLRQSSTDYANASNVATMTTAFHGRQQAWLTDPSTSVAWTQTSINSVQFGGQGVT